MSDPEEISNLFRSTNMLKEHTYRKVEYIQINDQQQGTYSAGQVSFNLEPQKSHFSVLSDTFAAIPFVISGASVTASTKYAMKNSVLSLIQGLQVRTSSGTSILNEQQNSTAIMANLRLLIDSTLDYHEANELWYKGCDRFSEGNAMGSTAIVGGVQPDTARFPPNVDALHNKPLANRISVFSLHAPKVLNGADYTQSFIAYIPLRWLHDWFAQMDFPLNNSPFEITFNIAGVQGYTGYCPLTCPTLGPHQKVGTWDAPAAPGFADLAAVNAGLFQAAVSAAAKPTLQVGVTVTEKGYTQAGCRLFLKVVQFHDEDALKIRDLMAKGYRKELTFTSSDFFSFRRDAVASISDTVSSQLIGSSFIRPERVWVLPVASGTLASANNTFPAAITPGGQFLTNTNIMVNGITHYQQNLRSQYEFYKLLREQMIGSGTSLAWGSPISYEDFLCGINPYCFDLSRHPSIESNTQVTLNLTTDIAVPSGTVPALDLIVIVERLNTHILDVSMGGVLHVTRQGSNA